MTPDLETTPFLLLCGGENSRLGSLRGTFYKPFLDLDGTTLVAQHVVRAARAGHRTIRVVVDEPDALAQAGVAGLAASVDADIRLTAVRGEPREKVLAVLAELDAVGPCVVALGDTYARYGTGALLSGLAEPGIACCIAVARYRLPFGVVTMSRGRIDRFDEKPLTEYLVNLGIMAFAPAGIEVLRAAAGFGSALSTLAAGRALSGVVTPGDFVTADSLADIARILGPAGRALFRD